MIGLVGSDPAAAPADAWDPRLVALYREKYATYVRLAYLTCGDRAAAEELVQDAFVASRRRWDGVREPGPYVRAAVVNACRSWGRRQVLERERRPAAAEHAQLGADHLWDALATLTDRQRAAVVLRFYEGLPDAEIAGVLGCRETTVRTTIHRALQALRREIER